MASLDKTPQKVNVERWKIFLGVALVFAIAYFILVHWWFTAPMMGMGDQIDDLRSQELQYRMEASQRPELERKLAEVRQLQSATPHFLPEANKELASAALVQRLEQVVSAASPNPNACQITARTPTDNALKEEFQRVTVQVRLRCGMTEMTTIMHSLEGGSPQLFIDNLELLSRASYNNVGPTGGAVEVVFDLFGYIQFPPETQGKSNG
ncbi:MAG: type II secretion system protein GspM [Arenimonas sp.]